MTGGTMTNEERAEKLIDDLFQLHLMGRTKEVAIKAILAYADEIRRECADKADVWAIKELAIKEQRQRLRAAIMGRSEG